ncbi:hypothetical protein, partial [Kaarinaea lacus]
VSKTSVGITTYYSSGDIGVDKETAIDTAKDAITSELDGFSSADLQSAITRLEEKLVEIINNIGIGYNKDYWVVNVEDANPPTPDNYFDDLYGLSGGGLYIDVGITGGTAYQVNLANVVMGNNCKINPSAGEALINELEVGDGDDSSFWPSFGSVTLAFNDVCDGQAYVENGIGSYGPINGERVPLKFND